MLINLKLFGPVDLLTVLFEEAILDALSFTSQTILKKSFQSLVEEPKEWNRVGFSSGFFSGFFLTHVSLTDTKIIQNGLGKRP